MNAPLPAEPKARPAWRRNARVLALGNLFQTMGFNTAYPFLPLVVQELGVRDNPESWVGIIVGALFTLSFLLSPVWGGVADHFGYKPMVLRAGLGMGLGYALAALSPTLGAFLAAMLIVAVCNGYTQAVMAFVAANTPGAYQGRAQALTQAGMMVGSTLGPALGVFVAARLGNYQALFWVTGAASFAGGVVALVFVQERHARPPGAFRLRVLADLRACLRVPGLDRVFLLNLLYANLFFGSGTSVALLAQQLLEGGAPAWGLGVAAWVGIVTLALTLSSIVALPLWGRALDRFDPALVLTLTLLTALLFSLPFPFVQTPAQLALSRAALGLFAVGAQPALARLTRDLAPPGMVARALGFGNALFLLGNGTAPLLAGIIGPWLGLRAYFGLNVMMVLAGLLLWTRRPIGVERA
jgi:MFS family permease